MKINIKFLLFVFLFNIIFLTDLGVVKANEVKGNLDDIYIELDNGMTKEIYSRDDAIRERIYVESEVDTDGDGVNDRIAIDVIRPKTEVGVKLPVIYEMSPYRAGTNRVNVHELDRELFMVGGEIENLNLSTSISKNDTGPMSVNLGTYGNYYVPRGYAVVLGYSLGNGPSEGCPTIGDINELKATTAVIDWLNGRTKGYTEDNEEVVADWSTGNVGMIGLSFNGALANGAATTGVEGLKTIVPGGAISSWYDYSRSYGAIQAQQGWDLDILAKYVLTRENPELCDSVVSDISERIDRKTADYNDFWNQRNYLKDANNIKASVLLVHGLSDWNVKTKQFGQWWEALKQNNVQRKMYLHQGGHSMPRNDQFQIMQHKWFDYWLYGIENNIMEEPVVTIERENSTWSQQSDWPHPEVEETELYLHAGENGASGLLNLNPSVNNGYIDSFTDDAFTSADLLIENIEESHSNRLAYLSNELTEEVLFSGTPKIKIRASIDRPVTNLTALLIDYDGKESKIITRGWMDPQNYESISSSKPITPNEEYTFEWGMQPNDYVFKAGHKIGIVIMQSDYDYTIRPTADTRLNLLLENSEVLLPIVGKIVSEVDKTALKNVLDKIQLENLQAGDYTVNSWSSLQEQITKAEITLQSKNSTDLDVEEALKKLNEAYDGLEKISPVEVDKSVLQEAIDKIKSEKLQKGNYTEASWSNFEKALIAAEELLKKNVVTEDEIEKSLESLNESRLNLVMIKEGEAEEIEKDETNEIGGGEIDYKREVSDEKEEHQEFDENKLPNTGTKLYNLLLIGFLMIIGPIIIIILSWIGKKMTP